MKTITIKFSGIGGKFNPEDNFIINILKKYFTVKISDKPDYLIYSVVSKDYLNYDCVRIFYTPENVVPDFNICDYAIGFHYLDFADRYIRFPIYLVDSFKAYQGDNYGFDLHRALYKHENAEMFRDSKTDFCAFVYSNAEAAKCRVAMYEGLSNYKKVNSGGRYLNNTGGTIVNKLEFQKKHKFVIAFENTSTDGYTTEKIVHAFSAGAVPIYWGNPLIAKEFNEKSFINCHEFGLTEDARPEAIKKIVEKVKELDQKGEKYYEMLKIPAFVNENFVDKKKENFEYFLYHIFSQDKERAYRRNRYCWGERYERKQKIGNIIYWQCRKLIPVRDAFRKIKIFWNKKTSESETR